MADEAERDVTEEKERKIGKKIEAMGGVPSFIWIGIVLLTGVQAGWSLAIIGLITRAKYPLESNHFRAPP